MKRTVTSYILMVGLLELGLPGLSVADGLEGIVQDSYVEPMVTPRGGEERIPGEMAAQFAAMNGGHAPRADSASGGGEGNAPSGGHKVVVPDNWISYLEYTDPATGEVTGVRYNGTWYSVENGQIQWSRKKSWLRRVLDGIRDAFY